jgi:hypothetical protein
MVFGDFRMANGEVASKLDSGGRFEADSYSDSESNLPKVEVAGSIPVSRSSFVYGSGPRLVSFGADWRPMSSAPVPGNPASGGRGRPTDDREELDAILQCPAEFTVSAAWPTPHSSRSVSSVERLPRLFLRRIPCPSGSFAVDSVSSTGGVKWRPRVPGKLLTNG